MERIAPLYPPPWQPDEQPVYRGRRTIGWSVLALGFAFVVAAMIVPRFGRAPVVIASEDHIVVRMPAGIGRTFERRLVNRPGPKDLAVHVHFKLGPVNELQNLFQTGPKDRGLRAEVAAPSTIAIIVQARDAAGHHGYRVFVLSGGCQPDTWHDLDISMRAPHMRVLFDGHLAVERDDAELDYVVNDIAFGTGYSKSRPIHGTIDAASFSYAMRSVVKTPIFVGLFAPLGALFIIGGAATLGTGRVNEAPVEDRVS